MALSSLLDSCDISLGLFLDFNFPCGLLLENKGFKFWCQTDQSFSFWLLLSCALFMKISHPPGESLLYFSCSIFKMLLNCHFKWGYSSLSLLGNTVKWGFNLIPSETNSLWCYCLSGLLLHPPPSCDPPVKWCVQGVTKFHVYFALCLGCIFCSFDVFVDFCLVTLNHSTSRIFAILGLAAYPALYQHFSWLFRNFSISTDFDILCLFLFLSQLDFSSFSCFTPCFITLFTTCFITLSLCHPCFSFSSIFFEEVTRSLQGKSRNLSFNVSSVLSGACDFRQVVPPLWVLVYFSIKWGSGWD